MLETIAIVLIVLWLLGLVTSYTAGGFIHALLVIAVPVILIRVIQGRKPLKRPSCRSNYLASRHAEVWATQSTPACGGDFPHRPGDRIRGVCLPRAAGNVGLHAEVVVIPVL